MKLGSLFDGISGFPLAGSRVGIEPLWASEVEPFAQRVAAQRFPAMRQLGDIKEIRGDAVPAIDILTGGFPCQDISVAGRRAGLAGERSGLWWEFDRLIGELQPAWVVIENVPGLLSSNGGRDMGTILGALAQRGYGFAYRVLDAQYAGVPQRRRRVFVVGRIADWRGPVKVLLEPEGVCRDHPPRREAREELAGTLGGGSGSRGYGDNGDAGSNLIAGTVSAKWAKGTGGPAGDECYNLVAGRVTHALTAEGHDASEDGTGRGTPLIAFNPQSGGSKARLGVSSERVTALSTTQTPAIAYQCHGSNVGEMGTLRQGNGGVTGGVPFAITERTRDGVPTLEWQENLGYAMTNPAGGGRSQSRMVVDDKLVVRRLTPLECERLQGFPDNWTNVPGASDSARYRALGNAVAVPVVEWILGRIVACEEGRL